MNTAERHANEPIRLLPGLSRFFENPTLETLGPINLDKHHPRDHEFLRRLGVLAPVDPEILQRVIMIRTKLANNIKITNKEADELINTLRAKHFSTDLNLSGHQFSTLEMDRAVIKGDLDLSNVSVNGDSNQLRMKVGGYSDQYGMKVGGSSYQEGMEVGGSWIDKDGKNCH